MTDRSALWAPPPASLTLEHDDVHVWRIALDQPAARLPYYAQTLAPNETTRASRFYFERDRHHFTVGRGALRMILSRYIGLAPHELQFTYTSYGKPALSETTGGDSLRFNLSHSAGMALCAVTRNREVGVDIEGIRRLDDLKQIAGHFFSANESAVLHALPEEIQVDAFFTCWTRKEAYIKAIGEGLSMPLDCFDVSLVPGEPAALLAVRGNVEEAERWLLRELHPGPGYLAAIVVEGRDWRLQCWQWPV
ncbi:MAG TPA: 4'-phosphopantetheinyl transferase superfamily protein [Herpetosiphonaceae bacterium]